jgi:hypothetical protein
LRKEHTLTCLLGFEPFHPAFRCAPEVPPHLDLASATRAVACWLRQCVETHPICFPRSPQLPKRLLNLERKLVRVVDTATRDFSKYMTLSHCWGQTTDMIQTTKQNLAARIAGIDWDELPPIFKDAIQLARNLDCQWIWIDSLCIVQDDAEDWEQQAAQMASIYSNSFLNIAATSSSNGMGSLFTTRKNPGDGDNGFIDWPLKSYVVNEDSNHETLRTRARVSHSSGHNFLTKKEISWHVKLFPLLSRAWVFQERLLSPRTIHFGPSEMIWECGTGLGCECSQIAPQTSPPKYNRSASSYHGTLAGVLEDKSATGLKARFTNICQTQDPNTILDFWLEAVSTYSAMALTKHSDRPYALIGVAERVANVLKSEYFAGLWSADLPRALLWRSYPRNGRGLQRPSQKVPTWSWQSRCNTWENNCTALYPCLQGFVVNHRVQIHKSGTFCVRSVEESLFGPVLSGQIDMTAPALYGKLIFGDEDELYGHTEIYVDVLVTGIPLSADCWESDQLTEGEHVACLLVGVTCRPSGYGCRNIEHILVLRFVEGMSKYKRIGTMQYDRTGICSSLFDDAIASRFQIV